MLRRLPILPTLLVLVAVAVMIRLGFWQLDRLHQKEAMIARFEAVRLLPESDNPNRPGPDSAYQRRRFRCEDVESVSAIAGSNASGESGWAHVVRCRAREYTPIYWDEDPPHSIDWDVVIGWSRNPVSPVWRGGQVRGTIARGGPLGVRLVADPPLAGLEANARPDPAAIPNNHWSYAVQWFLFAATALVIYALALRKRLRGAD